MKEFGFYNDFDENLMLNEQIEINGEGEYLVSNSPKLKSSVVAPEINFYLKNTADSVLDKAKNTLLLYEARASAFDLARDIDYEKPVGKNVVIVSNGGRENLANLLKVKGFKTIELTHFEIKFIYGAAGELSVLVLRPDGEFEVDCDFFLVENAREYMLKQSGCYEIAGKSDEEIAAQLDAQSPKFKFKSHVHYDSTICQYHERRHEICGRCVEACPTVAILKEDETKHLVFSHIDCINCGVPAKANLENLSVNLPANVLPFAVSGERFLSETHLLTLLQESGAQIVIYEQNIGKGTKDAVDILNQIYELKFNEKAVLVAQNEDKLKSALSQAKFIEGSQHSIAEYALPKREIFARRLEWLVGDQNLGSVSTTELIRYGRVEINQDTCTLCLSCVGACNVAALVADKKTNSIVFNPSVCTACGYCELSCAEKDTIFLRPGKIDLEPGFFAFSELARDELFACIECGKEFATKKAVEKIASIMAPKFNGDKAKLKTLYCCSDCKAKVMIKAQMDQMKEEVLNG